MTTAAERRRPWHRTRRATALVLAAALTTAACGSDGDDDRAASTPAGGTAPEPDTTPSGEAEAPVREWPTWVIDRPESLEVPPPPEGAAAEADAAARAEQAGPTDESSRAALARWSEGPAGAAWQAEHLAVVAERAKDPLQASRGYALMSVAVDDAVVATAHWQAAYDREPPPGAGDARGPSYPSADAAIAGAASRLLAYLNPELPAARFEALAEEAAMAPVWAGTAYPSDIEAGLALGRDVAEAVIAYAEDDGSHDTWDGARPAGVGDPPAFWAPPPGSVSPPTQPLGGSWQTWVLDSGDQLRPPPPPPYGSAEFLAQAQEVLDVSASLTPEQTEIAQRWAGGQGTPLPPGIWTQLAVEAVDRHDLDAPHAVRALALVGVAQADAGVSCWDAKYTYWYPRPVNAIRDSGLDPDWEPLLRTPLFPSYTSGHATYSGAASEVLAYLFPEEADEFRALAEEAAMSRLYGGIHFRIDNETGLAAGRRIGELVVALAEGDATAS